MSKDFNIIQVSDLHISAHKNLLDSMIDQINGEITDLVIFTGDTVSDNSLYSVAKKSIDRINHRVVIIPGEYDCGPSWEDHFGDRYGSTEIGDYVIDFLDTSLLGHRFYSGWGNLLEDLDKKQYNWLLNTLKTDKYHLLFSHHPYLVEGSHVNRFSMDNIRAIYSGHLREPSKFYFKYEKPRSEFNYGFGTTALKFHGNSCYLLISVNREDNITHTPRIVQAKRTAW